MLDDLLQYHTQPEPGDFVAGVMRALERQRQLRRRILLLCGFVGAIFGALGVSLLAGELAVALGRISEQVFSSSEVLVSGSVIALLLAALAWLLHEEPGVWG